MSPNEIIIIPAQIRAARALLEWSQEKLASEAGVGLSTVRDVETQKRQLETSAATSIVRALQNAGVIFVSGNATEGPGVRLVAGRPHMIKPPTVMTMWDGMPFVVEWRGQRITVFVSREAMHDLGRFRAQQPDAAYLEVFEKFRGSILDGVAAALAAGRANEKGQLRLTGQFIAELQ
jgi:transcriptional regulator with XRE-family HTH domain